MKVAAWVAAALAVVVLVFFLFDGRNESASSLSPTSEAAVAQEAAFEHPAPQAEIERTTSLVPVVVPTPSSSTEPERSEAQKTKLATLRCRFLFPDGAPASGVRVGVHGVMGIDPEAQSDATGNVELSFDPPKDETITADATLAGFAKACWRWRSLAPGELTDLGTITLAVAGRIAGRVVDREGNALPGQWSVWGESSLRMPGPPGDATRVWADVEPQSGAFVLESLPPGLHRLRVSSARHSSGFDGPTVDVRAGETAEALIAHDPPDDVRRLHLRVTCRLGAGAYELASVALYGDVRGPIQREKLRCGDIAIDGLDPDREYRIEIRDPKFRPFAQDGFRTGTYGVVLEGTSAVEVQVVDDATATPIEEYRLVLRYRNAESQREFELCAPKARKARGGRYRGIVPGDITLVVESEGHSPASLDLDAVAAGETRAAHFALSSGASIRGRVVQAPAGVGISGVRVTLWPRGNGTATRDPKDAIREAVADERGGFAFHGLAAGSYEVSAERESFAPEKSIVQLPETGEVTVLLELPSPGSLTGSLAGIPDHFAASFELVLEPTGLPFFLKRRDAPPVGKIGEQGRFHVGPLQAGTYAFSLHLPGAVVPMGFSMRRGLEGARIRLGEVRIRAGEETVFEKDLSEVGVGRVRVLARHAIGQQPAAGITVVIRDASSEGEELMGELGGQTDAQGVLLLTPVFSRTWEMTANSIDGSWFLYPSRRFDLLPGGEVNVQLDVESYAHEIRVVDATTGDALPDCEFTLELPDESWRSIESDDHGRLGLRLPPCPLVLREVAKGDEAAGVSPESRRHTVQWTAGGPVPPVLAITRKTKR